MTLEMEKPPKNLKFEGRDYTPQRLEFIGTQMAEELNVKEFVFVLDEPEELTEIRHEGLPTLLISKWAFIVEHDPMRKHHRTFMEPHLEIAYWDISSNRFQRAIVERTVADNLLEVKRITDAEHREATPG